MKSAGNTKKDETRYTIRFNPSDPRQQIAMAALNTAGRRKATLIADAICEYFARNSKYENMVLTFHEKQAETHEQGNYLVNNKDEPIHAEDEKAHPIPASESSLSGMEEPLDEGSADSLGNADINNDMRQAIIGGLSMFNGQAETN